MAITENVTKNQCNLRVIVGQDGSGNSTLKNVSLGTLSINGSDWDAQKALNIAEALAACLTNSLSGVQHIQTADLVES